MKNTLVIGLAGQARSGKDTASGFLESRLRLARLSFADPIRDMLAAGLGLSPACFEGPTKERPLSGYHGVSPRHLMQTLGTEWGRQCVGPDIWLEAMSARIALLSEGSVMGVIIPDVRFANEAAFVRSRGHLLHIHREARTGIDNPGHVSELPVPFRAGDYWVPNSGSIEDLHHHLGIIAAEIVQGGPDAAA